MARKFEIREIVSEFIPPKLKNNEGKYIKAVMAQTIILS